LDLEVRTLGRLGAEGEGIAAIQCGGLMNAYAVKTHEQKVRRVFENTFKAYERQLKIRDDAVSLRRNTGQHVQWDYIERYAAEYERMKLVLPDPTVAQMEGAFDEGIPLELCDNCRAPMRTYITVECNCYDDGTDLCAKCLKEMLDALSKES
jgi:hypothetical protein